MGDIHKLRGIGDNSDALQRQSPTVEALEEQMLKVGKYISDITGKFYRIRDQVSGSHGDEVVVNPYETEEGKPDWHRVVRKPTKYERNELHFEAKKAISEVHERLTHLHLNIDTFINGGVKEITDQQPDFAKPVKEETDV